MKKITGKVVSLVLALALVVTSFSATFAFATTKSVDGTLKDTGNDSIYLVNGGASDTELSANLVTALGTITLDTKDHQDSISSAKVVDVTHSSGDKLVTATVDKDASTATIKLKNKDVKGKEILSVLFNATYSTDDGDVTVRARKSFTVNVLAKDSYVIGKNYTLNAGVADTRTGDSIEAIDTFATTQGSTQKISIYKVGLAASATDAKAVYTAQTAYVVTDATQTTVPAVDSTKAFGISATGDITLSPDTNNTTITATVGKVVAPAGDGRIANVVITAAKVKSTTVSGTTTYSLATSSDDKYVIKTKIEKKVIAAATFSTIQKDKSKTYLRTGTDVTLGQVDVSDAEVVFPDTLTTAPVVTVGDKASVKKISGTVDTLTISGSVSSVALDAGKVIVADGKVGDIVTKNGDVDVNGGKTGSITTTEVDGKTVTVTEGTVGAIKTTIADISATDEDVATITDAITAKTVSLDAGDSKITTGLIKSSEAGTITVTGSNIKVNGIDFDYYASTLLVNDGFVGTLAAPVNATKGTIDTEDTDTSLAITGAAKLATVSIGDETSVSFDNSVTVDEISGPGTLTVGAGKMYINDGVSGSPILKLSDKALSKGMTVYKADSDNVDASDFENYGFTVATTSGTTSDTFKIDTLTFAGLALDKASANVAVGSQYKTTFTASAYPGGTNLPAGATYEWEFDGSDTYFTVTSTGNTATVEVKGVDKDFASENKGTLTVKLVDADGYEYDEYSSASATVTAVATPDVKSDTNSDLSVAAGASYTFKITSATAPSFTTGTAGVFTVALASHTGNDYFYKITATGKVGAATGIFLNGTKLLVATVKAGFTSDTNKDVTVKGAYTVKITSATVPTFGVGTAGVVNAAFVTKTGNDYFYKLTSVGKVGTKAGVFVNGVKIFVATVG